MHVPLPARYGQVRCPSHRGRRGHGWVKDFNDSTRVDGAKACYVVGSNVLGPMAKELIPFATEEAARKFQQRNGDALDPYAKIAMESIKPLMGSMMHHMR